MRNLTSGETDRLAGMEKLFFEADGYTVHLDGTNNGILARDDAAAATADAAAVIGGLTDNDFDFDADLLSVTTIDTTGLIGTAVLNGDGTVTYDAAGAFDTLAAGETAETAFAYTVTDGRGASATATVRVTVTGVNDAPVLSVADATVAENTTAVLTATAADPDAGDTVTFTLGGTDAALFVIDPQTGAVSFASAPDFEVPGDADADNVYEIAVTATDTGGLSDSRDVRVTVTDVDEGPVPRAWINEFHYDNVGTDAGEFIEVAGTAGLDLTGWSLALYNGSNGTVYNTVALSGLLADTVGGFGFAVADLPVNGLQNGAPDGIALVDGSGAVVEFLSYEGEMTATDGPAAGTTSRDVGVAQGSGTPVGASIERVGVEDEFLWAATATNTRGAVNDGQTLGPLTPVVVISEVHYDNAGADIGEFIEIAGTPGTDLTGWSVVLYNGSNGAPYNTLALAGVLADSGDGTGYAVIDLPANGLQNGAPDGLALVNAAGEVVEFLSYEGSFVAVGGPADGLTSTDIGVFEPGDTPVGQSLQRQADGSWAGPLDATKGAGNAAPQPPAPTVYLNEFHYDNDGADIGEFIEVAGDAGADLTGWSIVLYNGNGGAPYQTIALTGVLSGTSGEGYLSVDAPGMQNGAPDGIALVNAAGEVVEFLSYEGTMTAVGGPADGLTSTDIGVFEPGDTPVGQSLQRQADGSWGGPAASTRDAENGSGTPPPPPPTGTILISAVQGDGAATPLAGQSVTVEAVVTAVLGNGFYLQEEDADADADAATSEGIFVFTGGLPGVSVADQVRVTGTVSEFFEMTQITSATLAVLSAANPLPTATGIELPLSLAIDLEAVEGMLVEVGSRDPAVPLTIIENFDFDRFGEIVISAGTQIQPTQIYDAQTQAAEIAALAQANAANRITLDDGVSAQNPTLFAYVANLIFGSDNGNGVLDSGDNFTAAGPTLRLGAELTAPVTGVMSYAFGEYKVIPTAPLAIDEATNSGAREATAPTVGGDLTVASFNTLNYFTTLGERGAFTASDLARQTEKLVNALVELDADIVGLQEIENNGFGTGSAIQALVDALNARLGSAVYAVVDPTGTGGSIGTDAITNGLIYKQDVVTVTGADILVFDDGGSQRNRPAVAATFEDADGERVTVAVNHLKSKGASGLTAGDPANPDSDQGDGQGFWNATRTSAAQQLTDWLATDPTGSGDPDYLIIGDLNAYNEEDPVQAIEAAGYANLLELFVGAADAFSFIFDGQQGALDHGLASAALADQVTGVAEWHINAQEPDLLSYNSRFTVAEFFNGGDPFAASDHDPLLIGLTLGPADPLLAA